MNIIICGAGRVGFTIAKLLSEQGHSITVIDQSSEDIQKIDDSMINKFYQLKAVSMGSQSRFSLITSGYLTR